MSFTSFSNDWAKNSILTLPFIDAQGLILIEAEINGEKGKFIFDTGADALLINSSKNESKGFDVFKSVNGEINAEKIIINSLKISDYKLSNIPAYKTNLKQLEQFTNHVILGIVGSHFFGAEIVHIDNTNGVIQFCPKHLISQLNNNRFIKTDIIIENDMILLPVQIGAETYNFCLDTGSSVSLVDTELANKADLKKMQSKEINLLTAAKTTTNAIYQLDDFNISKINIKDLNAVGEDLSKMNALFENKVSGVLSLAQLPISNVIIDFQSSKIYFHI